MVFDMSSQPLVEELKAAKALEALAVSNLLGYMQGGGRDRDQMGMLTSEMERTHNAAMDIWDKLQEYRLDGSAGSA